MHKNTEQVLNTEDSIHSPKDHGSRHDRHQFAIRGLVEVYKVTKNQILTIQHIYT